MISRYHLSAPWLAMLAVMMVMVAGCDRATPGAPAAGASKAGTGTGSATTAPTTQPIVLASIYPLGQILEDLVGDWARVRTLLPPGESEHGVELSPVQVKDLSDANLLVVVGMGLDAPIENAAKRVGNKQLRVLQFANLIGAPTENAASAAHEDHDHDHDHGHHHDPAAPNPHLWLDPVLTAGFIKALTEELVPMFPGRTDSLRTRARLLRANLLNMHQKYELKLARVPNKKLITFHNAFDLLARRYGLEVVGHVVDIELTPGGEPPPDRIREITDLVRKHRLHVLYAEPQLPDAAVRAIAESAGVKVLRLDPLGHPNQPGVATYVELMTKNLDTLIDGQSLTP